jgi:hypothetical protein
MKSGTLTRRDLLKLGLTGALLSGINTGCKNDPGTNPPEEPPEPGPVFQLTDGRTLYDDFDGKGGFQAFDNTYLAVAGQLSHKLWVPGASEEVVDNPVGEALFSVVDEKGQRVEYRPQERPVRQIAAYLIENPRPIAGFEREILEKLLNDRGKTVVVDLEGREIKEQAAVIQYVLDNRRALFNEKGKELIALISEKSASALAREGFRELTKRGFDESEWLILSRIMAEKRLFESLRNAPAEKAFRGGQQIVPTAAGWRRETREIKYVFDAAGKLVDAAPHVPGTSYDGAQGFFWLGPQELSRPPAIDPASVREGKAYGAARIVQAAGGGFVLKMTNRLPTDSILTFIFLKLDNPANLEFAACRTFQADVLLSSLSGAPTCAALLDYHTTIPEQPPGRSWATSLGIRKEAGGEAYLFAQAYNVNTDYRYKRTLGSALLDRWYHLRLDIVIPKDDPRLAENELRIDFYVDGGLRASEIPVDAEILLDPERTGGGPDRSLIVDKERRGGDAVAFFDNVRAVYENRVS